MKPRLINSAPVLFVFVTALTVGVAVVAIAADAQPPKVVRVTPPPPVKMDPPTGLPVSAQVWIDPNWKGPDKRLPEFNYEGVPLGVVADQLRKEFDGAFDVLIPGSWQDPANATPEMHPDSIMIRMQLKNVSASEVFNAMNMMFEAQNTPYRWELRSNGSRSTALLRILPQLLPVSDPAPPPPPATSRVYFVGDLLSGSRFGTLTMEQLVKTVGEVYQLSFGESQRVIQFHKDAQLMIVTGTGDQIEFVQTTLMALRGKMAADQDMQMRKAKAEKATPENPKPQ